MSTVFKNPNWPEVGLSWGYMQRASKELNSGKVKTKPVCGRTEGLNKTEQQKGLRGMLLQEILNLGL